MSVSDLNEYASFVERKIQEAKKNKGKSNQKTYTEKNIDQLFMR